MEKEKLSGEREGGRPRRGDRRETTESERDAAREREPPTESGCWVGRVTSLAK